MSISLVDPGHDERDRIGTGKEKEPSVQARLDARIDAIAKVCHQQKVTPAVAP